jgi:hypothetical protein
MSRIAAVFAVLKKENRSAFVPFVTAGDPDVDTFLEIVQKLPAAGADIIEIGIPFSDPMADGPTNQASYLRALKAGMTLLKLLEIVRRLRKTNDRTPLVLMGAYNPIHAYGTARFARDAAEAGVDGLLIVDLPVEEDDFLRLPAASHGIDMIRFPSLAPLISWAGICPRNDESAGKRRSNRLRKGAPWLKTTVVQCSWAAIKKKGSYVQAQYHRVKARRGAKKAIMAVAASILTAIYQMLKDGTMISGPRQQSLQSPFYRPAKSTLGQTVG